jgi:hypothetical protein
MRPVFSSKSLCFSGVVHRFFQATCMFASLAAASGQVNVLTYHNDNSRLGANTNETILTPANVNGSNFGKLFSYAVDGYVYGQPLFVSGMTIPGQGTHNVIFAVTEHDSVYALDADSPAGANGGVLWHANLGISAPTPNNDFGNRYNGGKYLDVVPEMGITSTPVIDLSSGTIYLDVFTIENSNYYHRIHALNITNGTEQPYSPVLVTASIPGAGVGSIGGVLAFSAKQHLQRPALTLAGGILYVAYSGYADTDPYHGWLFGFNATNLLQLTNYVFNTTPNATTAAFGGNAGEGGIWMSGNGLCVDANTNLYFMVGNGSYNANNAGGTEYGECFVKLSTATNKLAVADYFAPFNYDTLNNGDTDVGSGGALLLPDSAGSATHPHLIVGCGKEGRVYLVDRDNMGHFHSGSDSQIVQSFTGVINGMWSSPAYFNGRLYFQGSGDVMKCLAITNGVLGTSTLSQSATSFGFPGATPTISANGTNNAIAWVIQSDAYSSSGPSVLHAYDAYNLSQQLYNSSQNLSRDNPGGAVKFTVPTVVNGKVYVGTEYNLSVFGLAQFLAAPVIAPNGGIFTNSVLITLTDATPGTAIYYTVDGSVPTTNSLLYTSPFTLTNTAAVQAVAAKPGAINSGISAASFINSASLGSGTGLLGAYYSNQLKTFNDPATLIRVDTNVNFNWGNGSPDPSISVDSFTVRWTGSVQPQFNETYTFYTTTDDGVRLWVNGQLLVDNWVDQAPATKSGSIALKAQQLYNIRMEYYENGGGAVAQLAWSSPSTPQTIIPKTQLNPFTNPPPSVVLTSPLSGASYIASASVTVTADADAPYNPISKVSLYANSTLLGSISNAPYTITATGLAAGSYALTAVAIDGSGLSSTSAPVNVSVGAGSGQPYGLTTNGTVKPFLNMPTTFNGSIPALLSGTGAFSNTTNRTPASGLISYAPNTPLWSDAAVKTRYLAVPNNGGLITPDEQIGFLPTNSWTFPAGTVFVKSFDLVVNETNASVPLRRLETRLLVRDINGAVYGVTYKWRPDNSDADLLATGLNEDIAITNVSGVRTQTWIYPSPADCLTCHTPVANYVLGVSTRQLNGSLTYPATGITDNQLRTLNRLGLFNPAFNETNIPNYAKLSALTNLNASLEERARSYLDANCAQCHQPGGTGITFDGRYNTPLARQNITNFPAAFSLGYDNACIIKSKDVWRSVLYDRINTTDPNIQMPDFRNLIDTNAVQVFADWINSLPGTPSLAPPAITPNGGSYIASISVSLSAPDPSAAIYYTLDGSLPTTNSLLYTGAFNLFGNATVSASAFETNFNNSVAVSALFLVQPPYFTSARFLPNNQFQIGFYGNTGSNYVLEATTNLSNWAPISTNTAVTTPFNIIDPGASNFPYRYYRVFQQ